MSEPTQVTVFARKLVQEMRNKYTDVDIYLSGSVIIDNAFVEAGQADMSTLTPLMFLVLIIIVGLSLRTFTGIAATLVVVFASAVTALGLAGWAGIKLTPASVTAPTIILTLAVADSVHILSSMLRLMRQGKPKYEAIAESIRINLNAVFLTSATTAIGFLTMNFSDAPPFRDLGNIVAVGVMAAFLLSILFLPAFMAILPVRINQRPESADKQCCNWLANLPIHHRKKVLWASMMAVTVSASGLVHLEVNDNFIEYFSRRFEIRRATDFVTANLTGLDTIEYSLNAGEPGGISNPEYLTTLEAFANWYRKQPKVVHVNTITDTIKRLHGNMHSNDRSWYRLPGERDLAAQYLLLYEMSLPFGLDLNDQINVDKSATQMVVTMKEVSTKELQEMDDRSRAWLESNAPRHMFTYGSGLSVVWAQLFNRNTQSMLVASFGALVMISMILIIAFRSFKFGLLSLVPNLVPAFMAFGLWGYFVGQVGLGLSVIVSMTLGIVVDDTVHFLSKYLRARREHGNNPAGAVRYAFDSVGTAMWVTTIALVAGFGVMSLSGYRMTSQMGLMTAITISFALITDFLLLPVLLVTLERTVAQREGSSAQTVVPLKSTATTF
jgi:predicted RND superfamily exporter protein